ncbi:hypothetical protein [Marmoricola sp. RAF53]|uniref:hypothetical protein n=1 Tax=Marmoricola sp. RAF53 TaxID=3233059 RepID=UPI003F9B4F3F
MDDDATARPVGRDSVLTEEPDDRPVLALSQQQADHLMALLRATRPRRAGGTSKLGSRSLALPG